MRRVVGADMGVKAAGGVRDYEGLKAMVAAGATRVGRQRRRQDRPGVRGEEAFRRGAGRLLIRQLEVDRHVITTSTGLRSAASG